MRELIRVNPLVRVQHIEDWNRFALVDGSLVRRISGGMPVESSFNKLEPSMGPAVAGVVSPTLAQLSQAETNQGIDVKPIPGELITMPLFASTVSQTIFIADVNGYQVTSVSVVPNVIGGAGATVTVEALTGTQAVGTGVAQLTAALALNGVANTVLNGVLIAAVTTINAGQRFGIVMAGTLTGLVGLLTVAIKRV
jgi:hypothetical protein